ncbi:MAG: aminotransferase class V-fold PLP-dependent enzyme, partial [Fibrobacter sp.]|nr:aminotransferase class V-fold PLP-dependent enzyme [Fibrobacter sp.]
MSYFDYTANTPACAEALQRFCEVERRFIGNANSNHEAGHAAKAFLAQVTDSIAKLLGVNPEEIIYTSGASESNNTAIRGIVQAKHHVGKHIITNPLEHSSVSATLTALQEAGYEIEMVKIGTDGKIDLEDLKSLLRKDTVLVTVNAVDSELGTVQPLESISKIVREFPNCSLHMDATQAIGKTPINLNLADTASIGAHKFYGLS